MKKVFEKAFTLVELLIVVGIIGILAVTLMVTLNPAEAQRKSRDAKRLKDMQTLQVVIEQGLTDGVILAAQTNTLRRIGGRVLQQPCNSNFIGVNLCAYAKVIPTDPLNGTTGNCLNGATSSAGCVFGYYVFMSNNLVDYEINVRMESVSNAQKVTQDGGNSTWMVETFTNANTLIGAAQNP